MRSRKDVLSDLVERLRGRVRAEAGGWPEDGSPYRIDGLRDAVDAISRDREGKYGVCVDCEGRIPIQRLKAIPDALRCIDCQMHYEELWQCA